MIDPGTAEKYVFNRKIVNLYPMPTGRELKRHPTMIELSAPGAETIVLGVREPPILPLVRTFSREHPGGLPPFPNMRGTSFDPDLTSVIPEEEEVKSESSTQSDSGRNLKKRSRHDLDDDEETTRPTVKRLKATVKSCLKTSPKPSPASTPTPSGNGESSINNRKSKKRACDCDEEDTARPSTKVRLTSPAASARDVSPTPSARRSVRFASPEVNAGPSLGAMTPPPDNLLPSSSPSKAKERIEGHKSESPPPISLSIVLPPRKKQKVRKASEE